MTEKNDSIETLSLLFEFISRSKHEWWKLTEKHGLTPLQLHILELLSKGPMQMNSLCNTLLCDASNVTGIVDRLASHGWIERREHPSDRRVKLVTLTKKGEAVRSKVLQGILAERTWILDILTPQELANFNKILKKLNSNS